MQVRITDRPVEQVIAAIQSLDLDPIKFKLMDPEEGQGWSRDYVDRVEVAYKQFLTLLAMHPEETLATSKDVDKFWHGHILDTLKYAEDCHRIFGYFVHHFPYFGMRGAEDAANLAKAAEITQGLHRREFGDGNARAAASAAIEADNPAYCSAIDVGRPAYCSAIQASRPAYCSAIDAGRPAYCSAIQASRPAYCSAINADRPAYCSAVTRDKLNVSQRPSV